MAPASERRARCPICGAPLVQPTGAGRPRQFCGRACQRVASRQRKLVRTVGALVDRRDARVRRFLKDCGR